MNQKNIKLATKIKVYMAVVLTGLVYGCETWTLYRYTSSSLSVSTRQKKITIAREHRKASASTSAATVFQCPRLCAFSSRTRAHKRR